MKKGQGLFWSRWRQNGGVWGGSAMSDITGDPGSQLPYQEFSPYYLAPIGSWNFPFPWFRPDPGGLGLECDSPGLCSLPRHTSASLHRVLLVSWFWHKIWILRVFRDKWSNVQVLFCFCKVSLMKDWYRTRFWKMQKKLPQSLPSAITYRCRNLHACQPKN